MKIKKAIVPIILTILLVIGLCCICVCLIAFASGAVLISQVESSYSTYSTIDIQPTPESINTHPVGVNAFITLETLENTIVPVNDPIKLVSRLGGAPNIPAVLVDEDAPYEVGARKQFWVTNVDTNENFLTSTVLRYVGENTYLWIEEGIEFNQTELDTLGDTFDQVIVPTNREFFGSEWNPGVDGDPHIYIVYAGGLGNS